jgi:dTDP-glucose 4,6-dehydratase
MAPRLQVSTDEVYGEIFGPRHGRPLCPQPPPARPGDAPTRSATYDLPVVITRCSNNYGPYQFPEKLIPLFATNALDDKPLPVYGNGKNTRDWIHVSDHCRAIEAVLTAPGVEGEIFNVAAENELDVLEIAAMILEALDKPKSLLNYVADRRATGYALDAGKTERAAGWGSIVPRRAVHRAGYLKRTFVVPSSGEFRYTTRTSK